MESHDPADDQLQEDPLKDPDSLAMDYMPPDQQSKLAGSFVSRASSSRPNQLDNIPAGTYTADVLETEFVGPESKPKFRVKYGVRGTNIRCPVDYTRSGPRMRQFQQVFGFKLEDLTIPNFLTGRECRVVVKLVLSPPPKYTIRGILP